MRRLLVRFAVFPVACCLSVLSARTAPDPEDKATLSALDSLFRDIGRSQKQTASRPVARAKAREYFQNRYDMDSVTLDQVTKAAASYASAVATLDAEAAAMIRAAKQKNEASGASRGAAVPSPPQLAELQKRKDALIRRTLGALEIVIGPAQLRYLVYHVRVYIYFRPNGVGDVVR